MSTVASLPHQRNAASDILALLTLAEKASLLAGVDDWHLAGIPRLGIPSIRVTDCGHGVTLCGDRSSCATCFPTGIGMAATWNESLVERIGAVIGREAKALGCSILLGPKVNLHRLPVNGRSFETFSEDPVLAGRLGAAEIRGIQAEGVGACVKAMAANNQQQDQERVSSEVDERTLRELYLRAFEIAVEEGKPCSIMTSYNRLNGAYASENRWLIQDVIKGEWRFPGLVVSDWRAVRTAGVYRSGLDLEMPGPGTFFRQRAVLRALEEGELSDEETNDKVERFLRVLLRYGQVEGTSELIDSPAHHAVALAAAEESIVLLKNEGRVLPLDRYSIRRLLVVGPNAAQARLGGGGSASVTPFYSVSPLDGIVEFCADAAVEVEYIEGCSIVGMMEVIREYLEHAKEDGQWAPGLKAEFYNGGIADGTPDAGWDVPTVDFSWGWASPGPGVFRTAYCARFSGRIMPPVTGRYRLGVFGQEGCIRLSLNGQLVVDEWTMDESFEGSYVNRYQTVEREFTAGVPVEITLEYGKRAARGAVRLEWETPGRPDPFEAVADAARKADAVIVCAGLSNLLEGGSRDRADGIGLPPAQRRLIEEVAAANPRTIVTLFNGGPVAMPWEPKVSSILEAWYPGQEGGRALARVLFGETNPSGKLPDTIAYRLDDHRAAKNYPGDGNQVVYEERLFVGYRHFDSAGVEPHYPFGFGLSYTTFEITPPALDVQTVADDEPIVVRARVRNTGHRVGKETVQVYVRPLAPPVERPDKELRDFRKVELAPGEEKELVFTLHGRALAYFDVERSAWVTAAGRYEILVGSHSRALFGATVTVSSEFIWPIRA